MISPIDVVVAEDQAILRDGLRLMLESHGSEFRIVAEAENGKDVLQQAITLRPHLILLDIRMPCSNGTEVLADIKRRSPGTKVIVLTQYDTAEYVRIALEAGADGYFVKNDGRQALLDAIHQVLSGESYLSPRIQKLVVDGYRSGTPKLTEEPSIDRLSKQERAIIKLVAEGTRNKDIAEFLSLSERTIEKYRSRILTKLSLSSTSELIRYALGHGLA
jgi:DNA-binding NarL/FixJ family response regulator